MRALLALLAVTACLGATPVSAASLKARVVTNLTKSRDFIYVDPSGSLAAVCTYAAGSNDVDVFDVASGQKRTTLSLPAPSGTNHQGYVEMSWDRAFISTAQGVQAYSLVDGHLLWSDSALINAWGPSYSNATGWLFAVSAATGHLFAYDHDGKARWNYTRQVFDNRPFVTRAGGVVLVRNRRAPGGLVAFDAATGVKKYDTSTSNAPAICPFSTSSRLQMFQSRTFGEPLIVMGKDDVNCARNTGTYTLAKVDPDSGAIAWVTSLGQPPIGSTPMDMMMTETAFNYWAYNGSDVDMVNTGDGTSNAATPLPTKDAVARGLLNVADSHVVSLGASNTLAVYDEMDATAQTPFALPSSCGRNIKGAQQLPATTAVPGGSGLLLTGSAIVQITDGGFSNKRERRAQRRN